MSIRCQTSTSPRASLYQGFGATGAVIRATTATGSNGPGLMYTGTTAADNAKEISYRIVTPPSAGTFIYAENGAFSLTGAANGIYSITFEKYDDQTSVGQATSTVTIGGAAAGSGYINIHPTLDGRAVIFLGAGMGVTIPGGQAVWLN